MRRGFRSEPQIAEGVVFLFLSLPLFLSLSYDKRGRYTMLREAYSKLCGDINGRIWIISKFSRLEYIVELQWNVCRWNAYCEDIVARYSMEIISRMVFGWQEIGILQMSPNMIHDIDVNFNDKF